MFRFFAPALLLLITACATPAPVKKIDYRNFNSDVPITFNAVTLDVLDDYTPRNGAPAIDHLMEKSPSAAVRDWATQRLRTTGSGGYVQVRIRDASVITRALPKTEGIRGAFTNDQAEELVAHLVVDVSATDANRATNGYTTIEASQMLTVAENASVADRKMRERELLNKLMVEFNRKAETGIRSYLSPLIVN